MFYLTDDKRLGKVKWVQKRASKRMPLGKLGIARILENLESDDYSIVIGLIQPGSSHVGVQGDSIEP